MAQRTVIIKPTKDKHFAKSLEEEELELQEMNEENPEEEVIAKEKESDPKPKSNAQEHDYEKRYKDLQSWATKEINKLKSKLAEAADKEQEIVYPTTEEEIKDWMEQYPKVYSIVETIALKSAEKTNSRIKKDLEQLKEREAEFTRRQAFAQLLEIHPDFNTIRESDEFREWIEEQPKAFIAPLYTNVFDEEAVKAAAKVVSAFKVETGFGKKKPSKRDAAKSVSVSESPAPKEEKDDDLIYESDVQKMSISQYERMEKKINEAMRSGKFVFDVSGGAR